MPTHRRLNNVLTLAVGALGLYIVLSPVLPAIGFWWQERGGFTPPAYSQASNAVDSKKPQLPVGNRLAIPSINLDEAILEGESQYTVDNGLWRRPNTSTPAKGGNTVIVGHRFTYSPNIKQTLYHLDKVKVGDEIALAWEKIVYRYRVKEIRIVEPSALEVESPSEQTKLTIYTCTPIWTSDKRLVVVSELIEKVSSE